MSGQTERLERRVSERRLSGSAMDVSRLEHENVFRQVQDVLRRIERIELELHQHDARLDLLEQAVAEALRGNTRPK